MFFSKKENKKEKMRKLLVKVINLIKKEKEIPEKLSSQIIELSNEWNKTMLFSDFVDKVKIFFTYDDAENFPVDSWVDSFFEKDYNSSKGK